MVDELRQAVTNLKRQLANETMDLGSLSMPAGPVNLFGMGGSSSGGGGSGPRLSVNVDQAEYATPQDEGEEPVPEPGTELGALDEARLAELLGRPMLSVSIAAAEQAAETPEEEPVPEPGTELGALNEARLAKLLKPTPRAELMTMRISQLRKMAEGLGVDRVAIDVAFETEQPRPAIVDLILAMQRAAMQGLTRNPMLSVSISAVETATGEEGEEPVPEPGTELGALDEARLAELLGRPMLSVSIAAAEQAAETPEEEPVPEPGTELGALDEARLQELMGVPLTRAELMEKKVSQLRRLAEKVGAERREIDAAIEADKPRHGLADLILRVQAAVADEGDALLAGFQEPRSPALVDLVVLDKGRGEVGEELPEASHEDPAWMTQSEVKPWHLASEDEDEAEEPPPAAGPEVDRLIAEAGEWLDSSKGVASRAAAAVVEPAAARPSPTQPACPSPRPSPTPPTRPMSSPLGSPEHSLPEPGSPDVSSDDSEVPPPTTPMLPEKSSSAAATTPFSALCDAVLPLPPPEELAGMKVSGLRKLAQGVGVATSDIDAAFESPQPKGALVEMMKGLLAQQQQQQQQQGEAEGGEQLDAEAVDGAQGEVEAVGAKLEAATRSRPGAGSSSGKPGSSRKTPVPGPVPREQLLKMKVSGLRKLAEGSGVPSSEINLAFESGKPKAALVRLLAKQEALIFPQRRERPSASRGATPPGGNLPRVRSATHSALLPPHTHLPSHLQLSGLPSGGADGDESLRAAAQGGRVWGGTDGGGPGFRD